MGGRARTKKIVKEFCVLDDNFLEALDNCDTGKMIVYTMMNVFDKCSNCMWRFKCGLDVIELLDRKTGMITKSLDRKAVVDSACYAWEYISENMEPAQQAELIEGALDRLGMDLDEIIPAIDEMFGRCVVYNKVKLEG